MGFFSLHLQQGAYYRFVAWWRLCLTIHTLGFDMMLVSVLVISTSLSVSCLISDLSFRGQLSTDLEVRFFGWFCKNEIQTFCNDPKEIIQQRYHQKLFSALIPALEDPEPRCILYALSRPCYITLVNGVNKRVHAWLITAHTIQLELERTRTCRADSEQRPSQHKFDDAKNQFSTPYYSE